MLFLGERMGIQESTKPTTSRDRVRHGFAQEITDDSDEDDGHQDGLRFEIINRRNGSAETMIIGQRTPRAGKEGGAWWQDGWTDSARPIPKNHVRNVRAGMLGSSSTWMVCVKISCLLAGW